jgi:hypothetical protein
VTRTILSFFLLYTFSALSSAADPVTLTFNNLQVGEEVLDYYNGGFGSLGTGPGPNEGVSFTSDLVTVPEGVFGPPLRAEELTGTSGTMDLTPSFTGPFSFYYTDSGAPGSVTLYSGPDGTGTPQAPIFLTPATIFSPAGGLTAPFESAVFSAAPGTLVIDNVTFGAYVIREPSSIVLLFTGLVAAWLGKNPRPS